MKIKDQYCQLKVEYSNSIILIKSGNFYVTFSEDAVIFNYLFNYQINDDKVGFPLKSLEKVLFDLKNRNLNYVIVDSLNYQVKVQENSSEYYHEILKVAEKYQFENSMNHVLIERIKYLISGNSTNYNKIKEFIDEL